MIIKKYTSDNMTNVMAMIKKELGPEAVIMNKRYVRQKGIKGLFTKKKIEITAAVDENAEREVKPISIPQQNNYNGGIEKELTKVTEMLQTIVEKNVDVSDKKVIQDIKPENENKEVKKNTGNKRGLSKKALIERDVSEEILANITSELKQTEEFKDVKRIPDTVLMEKIKEMIKVDENEDNGGRIRAFIGPTGVGKTTTIAKIAALNALSTGKKVGLITIDTYRIGAVEQLKIYADILGIPFSAINNLGDIKPTMEKFNDCDLIFIDTTGRSIKNVMQLSELKLYLDNIRPDKTYLTMSMTTKYNDMLGILEGFSSINYDSIVLTKFDETTTYGSIVNIAYKTNTPISYIATGQSVPNDIERATTERLVDLIFGEAFI
jgi:flagellar biosynthesis protein FlhF